MPAIHAESKSGVGEGLIEAGAFFLFHFARFQNFAAIETFHVLRVFVLGDQLGTRVRAGRLGHGENRLRSHPSIAPAFPAALRAFSSRESGLNSENTKESRKSQREGKSHRRDAENAENAEEAQTCAPRYGNPRLKPR